MLPYILTFLLLGTPYIEEYFRNQWRESTLRISREHLERHPSCDLRDLLSTIERAHFFRDDSFPTYIKAGVYVRGKDRDNIINFPIIFINPHLQWSEREAVISIIHEASHVTWRNGKWVCGDDNKRYLTKVPVCLLFGGAQYKSDEITSTIEKHLETELDSLSKEVIQHQ